MTHESSGDARLRDAFATTGESGPECPSHATIWRAATGVLPRDEVRACLEHSLRCRACAEAWRLAGDLAAEAGVSAAAPTPVWRRRALLASAAAGVLLALGLPYLLVAPGRKEDSVYRQEQGEHPAIHSLVPADAPLPRSRFVLRWSAGPDGARYILRVSTVTLVLVHEQTALTLPEHVVPESALDALPGGTQLLWRVEAVLPDGERLASPTFTARIE